MFSHRRRCCCERTPQAQKKILRRVTKLIVWRGSNIRREWGSLMMQCACARYAHVIFTHVQPFRHGLHKKTLSHPCHLGDHGRWMK
ncbi:hypothetical protein GOP47_0011446 [Adiantum capillus-veneris]|uniref:Uncharacterized protein n=1 Tax=Adiantum capillus-veneris TaxID=13818 RepID=A0A9D4ZFE7_ADICA|nr:hypothetical protein GOP47_0011446 [Adiantum capillus-veneris]